MDNKQHFISHHCRYVKGALCSAIYDLKQEKVYSLNADATESLEQALRGEPSKEADEFLSSLCSHKLLNVGGEDAFSFEIESRINYVWLELTERCNCSCLHCYGAFGHPQNSLHSELSLDEWKEVISTIKRLGGNAIQFIGGEPLLSPYFSELLSFSHQLGIGRIDIFTNGYLLDEEIAAQIVSAGATVRVSLYGYDAQSHDRITGRSGSFKRLDSCLKLLKALSVPTTIAVVLMRENQGCLDKIKAYIESVGHTYTGFDTVRKVSNHAQDSHAVTNEELLKQRYITKACFYTSASSYNTNKTWNNCWFGKFAVTAKGDIIPCIFARDLVCGNIKIDSFDTIKQQLLSYWHITKDSVETCKDCEYRYACDDCRPLASGELNDLYAKYPRCCYSPYDGIWHSNDTSASKR